MSLEAANSADLAALLDGQPPGDAEEAFQGLLGDEWAEVYPPAAQAELRARLDAAGWPAPFDRCPSCETVFLRRFRPDSGRCRECAAALDRRRVRRPEPAPESELPLPTRAWGEVPSEPNWELAAERKRREVICEEGRDFLAQRAQELVEIAARNEAAAWLGGGAHDPSDEVSALPEVAANQAPELHSASTPEVETTAQVEQTAEVEPTAEVVPAADVEPAAGVGPPAEIEPAVEVEPIAEVETTVDVEPAPTVQPDDEVDPTSEVHPAGLVEALPETGEDSAPDAPAPDAPAPDAPAPDAPAAVVESEPVALSASESEPGAPPSSTDSLQGAGPAELREETGRRAGRVHTLALGSSFRIGTARRGEVVLRQRGVAFKHAEVRVGEDGRATLTDLGTGQTWVNDEALGANETRELSSGDVLRCGEARLSVNLRCAAPIAPPAAPEPLPASRAAASEGPQEPWQPPSEAEVAAARHTPPSQILAALPASQLDLVARAARAIPLPRWRAAQDRAERPFVDHDAEAFEQLARGVLDGRFLSEDSGTWLRWEEDEGSFLCRTALDDGATVILAPWDLLARLPEPLPGSGPTRVGRFLELLLPRNTGRLVAEEEGELAGGFWRCRYASRSGLCAGRFSSIEARSNGHVLTATLTPRFPLQSGPPAFAEDPLDLAMQDLRDRPAWRPPPRGHGAAAPHVPRGGRHRERHLPRRSQARDHYR